MTVDSRPRTALPAWAAPVCAFVLPILLLAPFANKAYHLDDPLTLWTAQQIQKDPLRFFDYDMNWTGVEGKAYLVIKNPPLAMYYAAFVASVIGWGETGLHLAFLLPAAFASLGTYFVARRFCAQPLLACLAALFTPAVLISSSNVMTTVTMLAFYLWAVECWLRAIDRKSTPLFFLSGALMAASALSQYFGASTVPLLLAYTLIKRTRPGAWIAALAIPIAVILLYEFLTRRLFGIGLFFEAGNYASLYRASEDTPLVVRMLIGVMYTGGCIWIAFWFTPLYGRRLCIGTLVAIALAVLGGWFLHGTLVESATRVGTDLPRISAAIHFGLFAVAGALTLSLAAYDLYRARDSGAVLLFLWVFGAFAFAAVYNWTVNARSLLGMAAPAAILAVRQLERVRPASAPPWRAWLPIAPMAVVALVLVYADATIANAGRAAARHLMHEMPPAATGRTLYFGHWGFQYYMQRDGAEHVDLNGTQLDPGDVLVVPDNNMVAVTVPEIYSHRYPVDIPVFPWASTWNFHIGAAYYSNTWGPFPYLFTRAPAERYVALLIDRAHYLKDPRLENLTPEDVFGPQ